MKVKTTFFIIIVSLLLIIPGVVSAQQISQDQAQSNADRVAERTSKREKVREELMQTHSQFRVGVGVMPLFQRISKDDYHTLLYSLEYSYRVWNFLEVGFSTTYSSYKRVEFKNGMPIGDRLSNNLNFSITARYSWFNSRWVSLYSSVGIWGAIAFETLREDGKAEVNTCYAGLVLPEVTVLGVRVGRRLFGYVEPLCFSGRGVLFQAGLGFKF